MEDGESAAGGVGGMGGVEGDGCDRWVSSKEGDAAVV
jgi:hypothetical protein